MPAVRFELNRVRRNMNPDSKKVSIRSNSATQRKGTIMNKTLSLIAILAASSQLAFAEGATQEKSADSLAGTPATVTVNSDNMATTTSTLPLLSDEVGSSLESKLEARMEFDFGPHPSSDRAIASID